MRPLLTLRLLFSDANGAPLRRSNFHRRVWTPIRDAAPQYFYRLTARFTPKARSTIRRLNKAPHLRTGTLILPVR